MKPCLVDVNVWVALVAPRHSHNSPVRSWFEQASAGQAGWNRLIQLSVIRLLGNPVIMGPQVVAAAVAWQSIKDLANDVRIEMIDEPEDFDDHFSALLRYPVPAGKLVGDAYLAAVAIGSSRRLVTFDKGFRQFKGLDLLLLGS